MHTFRFIVLLSASSLTVVCSTSCPAATAQHVLDAPGILHMPDDLCFQEVVNTDSNLERLSLNQILGFDEFDTPDKGFGEFSGSYYHLNFDGFYPFDPADPALAAIISSQDLNCAVSKPNSLYGSKTDDGMRVGKGLLKQSSKMPLISVNQTSLEKMGLAPYFTLNALSIKPLDMPLAHAKLIIEGTQLNCDGESAPNKLEWDVVFYAGFHDMLRVKLEEFSKQKWERLVTFQASVTFQNGGQEMDWEFCIDDLEVEFTKADSGKVKH